MNNVIITTASMSLSPEPIIIYGDESTSRELVTYCLVVVPQSKHLLLEQQILKLFKRYGGSARSRFHCRELFSKEARDKTEWAHLNEQGTWDLAIDFATVLATLEIRSSVCVVHKSTYPIKMPDGKNGYFEIKAETCYAFGFYGASTGLRTHNIVGEKIRYILFVDQQNTRFNLFGLKTASLIDLIKMANLKPAKFTNEPLLLDAADLIAYAAARALSKEKYRNKGLCGEIMNILRPALTHWWWNAGDTLDEGMRQILKL